MEAKKGSIAKSVSGHDKGYFFVILDLDGKYAYIADGKIRKLEKPKRKSLKHLSLTGSVTEIDNLTNKKLRNVLLGF
ncbi:MAG: KOW domain-containing RNA-binding protein [Oscillospiraceae bacterium]